MNNRKVTPQDLNNAAGYIRGFNVTEVIKHDPAGGYRIISKPNFFIQNFKQFERTYPEIYLDRLWINDGLDSLFYSFDLKQDMHRFVINPRVHKTLLEDENSEMRDAARNLLDAIRSLDLDEENTRRQDEYVALVT